MKSFGSGPVTGDNAQTLSTAQKAQARTNIGAGTGTNAFFTGTSTSIPSISVGSTGYVLVTVTPAISGDSLAVGDRIQVTPNVDLPAGMAISFCRVSATNTARIGMVSTVAASLTTVTISWSVTAFR